MFTLELEVRVPMWLMGRFLNPAAELKEDCLCPYIPLGLHQTHSYIDEPQCFLFLYHFNIPTPKLLLAFSPSALITGLLHHVQLHLFKPHWGNEF